MSQTIRLEINGLSCAGCASKTERSLAALPETLSAYVNFASATAVVETNGAAGPLIEAVEKLGYKAILKTKDSKAGPNDQAAQAEIKHLHRQLLIAAALTLPIFFMEMGGHAFGQLHHWINTTFGQHNAWLLQFVLATAVLIGPGRVFFTKGIPALLRGAPEMNSLVALGAGSAWIYSTVVLFAPGLLPADSRAVYFEPAAVIITLILFGRWLEARAKRQTGTAIRALLDLAPAEAQLVRGDQIITVDVADLLPGDTVLVRPGAGVPADGVVLSGHSFVDEAMLTGEPIASEKTEGAAVTGGTVNGQGALHISVTAAGADATLAAIANMVETAQSARLPVQDLVNKITLWFVPAVLVIAVVTGISWLIFGPSLAQALVAAVSVLIIACPCAMGLATPASIMAGTGRAAQLGVLFRQGDALQVIAKVTTVAFDKTGTLTMGKPSLTGIDALGGDADLLLARAAAVERLSEHPLASAIVTAAKDLTLPEVTDFAALPGEGLRAQVDGVPILLGTARMMERQGIDGLDALRTLADAAGEAGQTPVLIAISGIAAGLLRLEDQIKPGAKPTIDALHQRGIKTALLTGDIAPVAHSVAARLGITNVHAGLLPGQKSEAIAALQTAGETVAFVGDGINDAPALAA
ncbi:MAG: heavy metal translocating P-type ATPase, partial [Rhodobacteraceae bacterium]|nr:heavy metal translocating P-type ATPase [Paracoccaceae bacterium]